MKPTQIHILGASGSGVSTLGTNLSSALSVPVFDVDDYFWLPTNPPFTTKRPILDRIAMIKPLLASAQEEHGGWVLAGSLGTWGGELMEHVEHVIFVDTPTEARMARLRAREYKRHGERIKEGGDMYEESTAFLNWAERYEDPTLDEGRSRKMHEDWLKEVKVPITRLQGDKEESVVIKEALEGLGRKK
ncbi:hypothetical protein ONS95_010950 [Cadophora gregata]|uniref:uncharacterized protein n=1 Tax=Cadophora gregata TaxID=51156 RepID=UPI0026DB4D49|nr:uncharacterized protein ONS95_010950 [Cadophora gregata]KAK0119505.1 hypothetical protein ONS95_010950 [Cadophora gregata]KAK0120550.1 hypothetical protein ONS96_010754 [Cadophora gregata f. sp. sojae]